MSQTGWTAKASREVQKHAGQLMKYGYHLEDPNTIRRAQALLRALRVYGPKNMDMKLGFLEGVNYNNPVLYRRAKEDAQYVRWLSGKPVPLPPGYPKVHRPNTRGSKFVDRYRATIRREPGTRPYVVRVFTLSGHEILERPFRTEKDAQHFRNRMGVLA